MFSQPAKTTWETFENFNKVSIPGAIVTMEGENNVVGSVRTIHYPSDLEVVESLDAYVNTGPHYLFTYSFTKPMLGVQEYMGTWIFYPCGKDGNRSKMNMFISWQPDDKDGNEQFETVVVDLLQISILLLLIQRTSKTMIGNVSIVLYTSRWIHFLYKCAGRCPRS